MPGRAYAGYFPLPAGEYTLRLRYFDNFGRPAGEKKIDGVRVREGSMNFIETAALY